MKVNAEVEPNASARVVNAVPKTEIGKLCSGFDVSPNSISAETLKGIVPLAVNPSSERAAQPMVPVEEIQKIYAQTGNAALGRENGEFHANSVRANRSDCQIVERQIVSVLLAARRRLGIVFQSILLVVEQMVYYAPPVNVAPLRTGGKCNTSQLPTTFPNHLIVEKTATIVDMDANQPFQMDY
jgi:hypothetical protein